VLVVPSNLEQLDEFERLGVSLTDSLERIGVDELARLRSGERLRLGIA
jgi:hypothetical protein